MPLGLSTSAATIRRFGHVAAHEKQGEIGGEGRVIICYKVTEENAVIDVGGQLQ